jgi:hypothetical protein
VHSARSIGRAGILALLASITVAGCSGFGSPKAQPPPPDPNAFPATYKNQILGLLNTSLTDRADFRGALIAPPVLKQVGDSQRYVVCLQFNGNNRRREKVVIYLNGIPNFYVDAKPDQCADAAYQPYKELDAATPE